MSPIRSRLARIVVGLAVAVGALVGVTTLSDSNPAQAASACVTRAEWRSVHRGQRLGRVMRTLGDNPWFLNVAYYDYGSGLTGSWSRCGSGSTVSVFFRHPTAGSSTWLVASKWVGFPGE